MEKFLFVLGIAVLWFWASLGSYIGGRIILPSMGLVAPDFWTWVWYVFVLCLFYFPVKFVLELLK